MPDAASDLQKLELELYSDQTFDETKRIDTFHVLFNPTEYTRTASNTYNRQDPPGKSKPTSSFGHGNPDTVNMALVFDGTGVVPSDKPVIDRVTQFLKMAQYRGAAHKPPYIRLRWGGQQGGLDFCCAMKTATANFTLFDRNGQPLRAKVSATFEEVMDEKTRRGVDRTSSADLYRVWTVHAAETIDGIAAIVYGDPAYWREIARANRLASPRALAPGMRLHLPPKER
ncbi:MAG: LysM peptidoglycan-binding domain-containing protein [Actinomycetota bacterium]|nr:LysM peptidoglycan-binding domain-containing protein [Actinomycetota bacterium]